MKKRIFKLWQRITLVAVLGAAPALAVTVYVISSSINHDIAFSRWESKGNEFQKPLAQLLDLLPRHQGAVRLAAQGDPDAKAQAVTLRQRIDESMAALESVYTRLGEDLLFTSPELAARDRRHASLEAVRDEWRKLKSAAEAGSDDTTAAAQLMLGIRTMLTHAGDTSNLILDPDLDSYYLMDMTVCALPQSMERIGHITLTVSSWINEGTLGQHRTDAAVFAALLSEADRDRIASALTEAQKSCYGRRL